MHWWFARAFFSSPFFPTCFISQGGSEDGHVVQRSNQSSKSGRKRLGYLALSFFPSKTVCRARKGGYRVLKEGDRIAKMWKGEGSVYAGTIDEIEIIDGVKAMTVIYDDDDKQVHKENDDSFDGEDIELLEDGVEPSRTLFSPSSFSYAAQQMILRHMESFLLNKVRSVICGKKGTPMCYMSVLLTWNDKDHLFYFRSLSPIQLSNDGDLVQSLAPLTKELPWKRFGGRGGNQRIQVCHPALIKRTKGGKTKVVFTYSRFDLKDEMWERQYLPPEGNPWDRKKHQKKDK
jgi:hypothetical protein